ncbi:MAG TPA: hypothetical protein VIG06_29925 [Kofleriaceae bacterium]
MAGPLGYVGGMAALRVLECPHCHRRQLRARAARFPIECKFCHKSFDLPEARGPIPKRRKKR